ncbi:hypothetical protein MHBO_003019 [Bonamia ostreae]|uniref:Uncharacterized protein n=1 Tax=Bonamia ostreae TaxID=126728 RepID=A0ABV2APN2_9EUKA
MSIQLPPFLIAFLLLCLKAEIAQNTKSELGLFTESTLEKEKIIFRTANDHLKAVDISTGKITWDISPKSLNEQTDKLKNRLVKGADGSLYFTSASSNSSFIHKLPLTIQKLVEKSPFLMEGFYILGSKKTSLLIINIKNGNILFEENIFSKNQNFLEKSLLNDGHLIYAVQSDFFVKIFSFESGKSWNSSLSELRVLEANSVFSNDFYVEMQSDGKTALKNKNKEVVWETFSGIFDAKMTTVYVTDNNKLLKIPIFYGPENNALYKNKNSVAEYLSYLKNIDKNGVPSRVPAIKGFLFQ